MQWSTNNLQEVLHLLIILMFLFVVKYTPKHKKYGLKVYTSNSLRERIV